MSEKYIDFKLLRQISTMDEAYACRYPELADFYKYPPELEQFGKIAVDKSNDSVDRALLVRVLRSQYERMGITDQDQMKLIDRLSEAKTFSITTAHQPSLLTGPLYYIYKAMSARVLADQISEANPDLHIQPIFVVGGEDHDFAEINHCFWHSQLIEWSRIAEGAVGRLSLEGLKGVLSKIDDLDLPHSDAKDFVQALKSFENSSKTYGEFALRLTQYLFGRYNILVLNMDDRRLKEAMVPYFHQEILERPSLDLVQETQQALIKSGFSTQAFPREINLFYLTDEIRERIDFVDGKYFILNTDLVFTEQEIIEELKQHPDRFSPNVVLRPIFQEAILPNLAYVGGGGEIAYWLERKSQFEHFGLNFPMLVRRDSALWVDLWSKRKLKKWDLSLPDLSQRQEQLINQAVEKWSSAEYSIGSEEKQLKYLFEELHKKAIGIDPSLGPMIKAQESFHLKKLQHLGGKIRKAEKAKHHLQIKELNKLVDNLFPGGSLQERKHNFLPIFGSEGFIFFEKLIQQFDPLNPKLKVIYEN